jgi:hypothetical protein
MDRAAENEKDSSIAKGLKQIDTWLDQQGGQPGFEIASIDANEKYAVVLRLRFPAHVAPGTYSAKISIHGSNFAIDGNNLAKTVETSFLLQIDDPWEKRWTRLFTVAVALIGAGAGALLNHWVRTRGKELVEQNEKLEKVKLEEGDGETSEPKQAAQTLESKSMDAPSQVKEPLA